MAALTAAATSVVRGSARDGDAAVTKTEAPDAAPEPVAEKEHKAVRLDDVVQQAKEEEPQAGRKSIKRKPIGQVRLERRLDEHRTLNPDFIRVMHCLL